MKRMAPWPDYAGKEIYEGDTVRHPDGEVGKVIWLEGESFASDAWRVNYGEGKLSRLCLQVGDKGQAVVTEGFVC